MKQKRKIRRTTVREGVAPTKERHRQNGGIISEAVEHDARGRSLINRYRAVWECPLDVYRDRRIITEPQHRAGVRFREAYRRAVLSRRARSERFNPHSLTTRPTMSEKLIEEAYEAVPSHNMGTVIDVCGHGFVTWSPKALESLRKGLGHLAMRWHMVAIEVCEHKKK